MCTIHSAIVITRIGKKKVSELAVRFLPLLADIVTQANIISLIPDTILFSRSWLRSLRWPLCSSHLFSRLPGDKRNSFRPSESSLAR